jgi:hydrogenase nickel incorporation protein HypA/HybF
MHEVSLVRSLLAQVLEAAKPLPPPLIRRVVVSTGPLSGVEPLLVAQAFQDKRTEFGLKSCELEIEESHLEGRCLDCNHDFEIVDFVFFCPKCNSTSIRVTHGDGFFLLRLEVEELDSTLCSTSIKDTLSRKLSN